MTDVKPELTITYAAEDSRRNSLLKNELPTIIQWDFNWSSKTNDNPRLKEEDVGNENEVHERLAKWKINTSSNWKQGKKN